MYALLCCLALSGVGDEPFQTWSVESFTGDVQPVLPPAVAQRLTSAELSAIDSGKPVPPFGDLTIGERDKGGGVWLGSKHGLMYLAPNAARWRLFHSRRWLPDDRIQDMASSGDGSMVWVRTPRGMARLTRKETTLDAKMAQIEAELRKRHVRHGLVGEINLAAPGKLDSGWVQHSSDNDGLWTSMYVGAEAYRYGVTHDEQAKKNARASLDALMFLERVTGIPGFVARSFVPIADDPKKYGGEWHRSGDGKWWWKGDTSSDELDGHYFAYAVYYDVVADEKEKAEIRQFVERITDHILDHGLYYVGPPGKPTTWGVWAPEKLNHDLEWIGDRGLNSLEILSHLKAAEHIVGKPRYAEVAHELIEKHSYDINTVEQKKTWPPEHVNHSDDELAFLAYHPLLLYERDPKLRKVYLASLRRSWQIERPEHSPFFNFIYAAGLQAGKWTKPQERPPEALVDPARYDRGVCLEWFRDVPADTIGWTIENSKRRDVGELVQNRGRQADGHFVLPPSERRVMKWNGDPYELDGGSGGLDRDDGTFILLPYWMGRYHRFLD
jgi:hypothetical protein